MRDDPEVHTYLPSTLIKCSNIPELDLDLEDLRVFSWRLRLTEPA
jgi:hypothetical protein